MSQATRIILNQQIVADSWQLVGENDALPGVLDGVLDGPLDRPLDTPGNLIVPLAYWQKHHAALAQRAGQTGVWLKGSDDPAQLQLDGAAINLPLIAVEFAQFVDGRGSSIGRLLRQRYGFTGELRAIGDVLRDQLLALTRCGFNAFVIKEGKSLEDALHAFDEFSDAYQNTVDQPVPYSRRRLAAQANIKPARA